MVKMEKIKPATAAERGDLIWRWILASDGEGMNLFLQLNGWSFHFRRL
jgi:hypothetical protein